MGGFQSPGFQRGAFQTNAATKGGAARKAHDGAGRPLHALLADIRRREHEAQLEAARLAGSERAAAERSNAETPDVALPQDTVTLAPPSFLFADTEIDAPEDHTELALILLLAA